MPHLRKLVDKLTELVGRHADLRFRFLEVCGTHTTSVVRHGLDTVFPDSLELISGPGCPVCVMPVGYIDQALRLAGISNVIVTTFGDLMHVPGSGRRTLADPAASGRERVRVVYSPLDALRIAEQNPGHEVVFLAVGFETTAPAVALALERAETAHIDNFSILPGHRLIPPVLRKLAQSGNLEVDGFLAPGHVSTIIGMEPYSFLPDEYAMPVVIGGFGPEEIIGALLVLVTLVVNNNYQIINAYPKAVNPFGNKKALDLVAKYFEPAAAFWRGLGEIEESGLKLREQYLDRNAAVRFNIPFRDVPDPAGCGCGSVLAGRAKPTDCPLFGLMCRPEHPVGPCMVSSEGSCAAYYRYGKGGSRVVPDFVVPW